MGRNKTKIETVTECIVFSIDNNPKLAQEFAKYHIENWDSMPCFRGGGLQGKYYFQTFFKEAKEKIDEFIKQYDKNYDIIEVNNFENYVK